MFNLCIGLNEFNFLILETLKIDFKIGSIGIKHQEQSLLIKCQFNDYKFIKIRNLF